MGDVSHTLSGAGLGLRRALMPLLQECTTSDIDFMEIAPENWLNLGGRLGDSLRPFTERFPFVCHGLSLSIGAPAPLNVDLVHSIKQFMREHNIHTYSEHLSYCGDAGQLYELLPLPFTHEAVLHVASRVRQCQDILGQRIALENSSYYCAPGSELLEIDFIRAVLHEADCDLLLDINNVFVNSHNHHYDPLEFIRQLPAERVRYFHIAGHKLEEDNWRIDTHGAPVAADVWHLLSHAYALFGSKPTLLERDFNLPPLQELLTEVKQIKQLQARLADER